MPSHVFGDIPAMLIGAHAAAVYAPARHTDDIDFIVEHGRFADAESMLAASGWKRSGDLSFAGTSLGLYGSAWSNETVGTELDVMSSSQAWCCDAFVAAGAYDNGGARVMPLPYLTLMKLDSARGIDQGDLTRILGRLDDRSLEDVIDIVVRHYPDPQVAGDVRQYAAIGRWEWETSRGRDERAP